MMLGNCFKCQTVGTYGNKCGLCGVGVTVYLNKNREVINPFLVFRIARGTTSLHPIHARSIKCKEKPDLRFDYHFWRSDALILLCGIVADENYGIDLVTKHTKTLVFHDIYQGSWERLKENHVAWLVPLARAIGFEEVGGPANLVPKPTEEVGGPTNLVPKPTGKAAAYEKEPATKMAKKGDLVVE